MRRLPGADCDGEALQSFVAAFEQQLGYALVGQREKACVSRSKAQGAQRRKRLRPTTRTPAATIVFADAHLTFQHALWPTIALAIGRVDHADRRAGRD